MKLPHPIPYQGSKRNLADRILKFFPNSIDKLIEPFAGSAAITIAAACSVKAKKFVINDVNAPLMELWTQIIYNPEKIITAYSEIWNGQLGNEEAYYYHIRSKFNETKSPEYLLFLLAKCVKAAVRYNSNGEFNQSPDKRRLGKNPKLMRQDILLVSEVLQGKIEVNSGDYQSILDSSTKNDLVYMDPPYQGTGANGGFNYAGNIVFSNFVNSLQELSSRDVPYILSYDGRTGDKSYGLALPASLNLTKIEINAGRSSQATLLNRNEITYEAVFLSSALIDKIDKKKLISTVFLQTELIL